MSERAYYVCRFPYIVYADYGDNNLTSIDYVEDKISTLIAHYEEKMLELGRILTTENNGRFKNLYKIDLKKEFLL